MMNRAPVDTVANHLNECARESCLIAGENSNQDEAHMAHARVGNQSLKILLRYSHERTIQDANDTERHHDGGKLPGAIGKKRKHKPDQAISSGF